jgi:Pyridoxamine 5'-phosphate oxidase
MGQQYPALTERHRRFIESQKIFFVGSAATEGRINVSPKGMDSLRILDDCTVLWLNVTGSGNETAAHVQQQPRMTLMFCAFEGDPHILRLYGQARVIHQKDAAWNSMAGLFEALPGRRQIFELKIDLVQTSCGMAVPFYKYKGERDQLNKWALKKGENGLREYWAEKNRLSLDGAPTHIVEKNT